MNKTIKLALLGSALALTAGPASAEIYNLCAGATTIDLPDGSSVPMWGYAMDDNNDLSDGCGTGVVQIPGPRLTVTNDGITTDGTLTINLQNNLPVPTSIVIPGLPMPAGGPTWQDNSTGARCANMTDYPDNCTAADLAKRVRSFGAEAAASGGISSYGWTDVRPGTFIYHSGTYPQKQVYMGLAGPVTQDADTLEAYTGVTYAQDIVLFYSDIDPAHNAAVAALDPDYTPIDYHASWFLVNGEPYSTDCSDGDTDTFDDLSGYPCASMEQTPAIAAAAAKTPTLLRFLSAASETHVPTLQGMHMTIHAEDGIPYTWEDTNPLAPDSGTAPREQYSVMLPPLKTKDAIIEPQLDGTYALYDGNGYMTNPTDPNDFDHQDPVGGMLRFLTVAADGNLPPVGNPDAATVVEGNTITIDVLANDSDPEGQPLTIAAYSAAT
ncbi:MAG: Ig-like domain-containing protein, partial [Chromatiales bacterium]